jgi:c-di-GMP-related signal transduction protein
MGLQSRCDGKCAFVNCTRDVLLKDYITLFASPYTVVEVLESVPPDDLVKAALERLKQAGYMIALDDFTVDDPRATLTDLADILKIDMQATTVQDRATLVSRYGPLARCRMLVENLKLVNTSL